MLVHNVFFLPLVLAFFRSPQKRNNSKKLLSFFFFVMTCNHSFMRLMHLELVFSLIVGPILVVVVVRLLLGLAEVAKHRESSTH